MGNNREKPLAATATRETGSSTKHNREADLTILLG